MARQKVILPVLMGVVALTVFALQSYNIGFYTPHHGWTSVHGLAIFQHATPENGFVGYAQTFRNPDGTVFYDYFDRYPFFFSAFSALLLNITDHLPTEVYIFRQYMNVIFLLTMYVAYQLVWLFIQDRYLALAATVLSFCSHQILYFKDMIHYDQPALLMMLVLIYVIALYTSSSDPAGGRGRLKWWHVYAAALVAVAIGRGYASFFVLALWFVIEMVRYLTPHGRTTAHPYTVFGVTVVSVIWAAGWLGYNVVTEANTRDVPITETSIVDSALRRLPFLEFAVSDDNYQHSSDKGIGAWLQFISVQSERIVLWSVPAKFVGEMFWRFVPLEDEFVLNPLRLGAAVAMLGWVIWTIFRLPVNLRSVAILLAFSGVAWTFFMINLTTKHIYVTMYGIGFTLMVYVGLFRMFDRPPQITLHRQIVEAKTEVPSPPAGRGFRGGVVVLLAFVLFAYANWQVRVAQHDEIHVARQYTIDFDRIQDALSGDETVYLAYDHHKPHCIINNDLCFALGYYLADQYLTTAYDLADAVLSPRDHFVDARFVDAGDSVTLLSRPVAPENTVVHLFDRAAGQQRFAPETITPIVTFDDQVNLSAWSLDGDVNLPPCGRIIIESWWYVDVAPDENYNMQVVMVDADGQGVAEANAPLTLTPTRLWETGRYTLDARTLTVPCDTPPGEYPMIMGVYHPDTLASLESIQQRW